MSVETLTRPEKFLECDASEMEKKYGLKSSVDSRGFVGVVNRTLARIFHQDQADVLGFLKDDLESQNRTI